MYANNITSIDKPSRPNQSYMFSSIMYAPLKGPCTEPINHVCSLKIMFRRFLFSRIWSSAQDHAVLVLLLNIVGFFISTRPRCSGGNVLYHSCTSFEGASRVGQPLNNFTWFIGAGGDIMGMHMWKGTLCIHMSLYACTCEKALYAFTCHSMHAQVTWHEAIKLSRGIQVFCWHVSTHCNTLQHTTTQAIKLSRGIQVDNYGVASISRLLQIKGLFCKRAL